MGGVWPYFKFRGELQASLKPHPLWSQSCKHKPDFFFLAFAWGSSLKCTGHLKWSSHFLLIFWPTFHLPAALGEVALLIPYCPARRGGGPQVTRFCCVIIVLRCCPLVSCSNVVSPAFRLCICEVSDTFRGAGGHQRAPRESDTAGKTTRDSTPSPM